MIIASSSGEAAGFIVIGVLGVILSAAVFLLPGVFDAATRMRLRMQGLRDDDEPAIARDRQRRRLIAMVLGVVSVLIIAQALTRL